MLEIWLDIFRQMNKFSQDTFQLKSKLTSDELLDRLREHTLEKRSLSMSSTTRNFIGDVGTDSFSIISSSFPLPYGATCVVRGRIVAASTITVTTTLHKGFRILYAVWLLPMISAALFFWLNQSTDLLGVSILIIMAVASIFRLYLHGMYVWARNEVLKKLKKLLEIGE